MYDPDSLEDIEQAGNPNRAIACIVVVIITGVAIYHIAISIANLI